MDKGCFGVINTDIENNMTCGPVSYPITKDKNVGLLKNYYVGKQNTWSMPVKEEVAFAHTSR